MKTKARPARTPFRAPGRIDPQEDVAATGAEVAGGFDEMRIDPLERAVEREEGERRQQIDKGDDHRRTARHEDRERLADEPAASQKGIDDAFRAEEVQPRDHPGEIAGEKGDRGDDDIEVAPPRRHAERHEIGEGKGDRHHQDRDATDENGAPEQRQEIGGVGEDPYEVRERHAGERRAVGEFVEGVPQDDRDRDEEDDGDEDDGRRHQPRTIMPEAPPRGRSANATPVQIDRLESFD